MINNQSNYMIFDGHVHINVNQDDSFFCPEYVLENLIEDMDKYHISRAIVTLNPTITEFRCQKDVANHYIRIADGDNDGELKIWCIHCGKVVYTGPDPLREYNEELLIKCSQYKGRILPFIYLSLANTTIKKEISHFESFFRDLFYGYKLHPKFSYRSLDEIKSIPSKRPLLIHTGPDKVDHPMNAIRFSKRYEGNIILAHFCRLNYDALNEVAKNPKLFIDTCPSLLLYNDRINDLFDYPDEPRIESELDLYYKALKIAGEDSIIFATDSPWGNIEQELNVLSRLAIPYTTRRKVSSLNFLKALSLEDMIETYSEQNLTEEIEIKKPVPNRQEHSILIKNPDDASFM